MKTLKFTVLLLLVLVASPFAGLAFTLALVGGAMWHSAMFGLRAARHMWGEA